jgi:hypothetical protein
MCLRTSVAVHTTKEEATQRKDELTVCPHTNYDNVKKHVSETSVFSSNFTLLNAPEDVMCIHIKFILNNCK